MFLRQKHVVNSLMKLAPDLNIICLQKISAYDKNRLQKIRRYIHLLFVIKKNSLDPDQMASPEVSWSESVPFAKTV